MQAQRLVASLTRSVALPSDAIECSSAPSAVLTQADVAASDQVVVEKVWFTTTAPLSTVLASIEGGQAREKLTLSAQSTGTLLGTPFRTLTLTHPATSYASDVSVRVVVAAVSGGTGIRVVATAAALKSDTTTKTLASATGVSVTVTRISTSSVSRSLPRSQALTLGHVIGSLSPASTAPQHCGQDSPISDTLTFDTPHGPITASASIDGCATIVIRSPVLTVLSDRSGKVNAALMVALGLPANYGL
jgi:hypothetical protein